MSSVEVDSRGEPRRSRRFSDPEWKDPSDISHHIPVGKVESGCDYPLETRVRGIVHPVPKQSICNIKLKRETG